MTELFKNGVQQPEAPTCAILIERLNWDVNGDENYYVATLSDGQRIKVPNDALWIESPPVDE